MNQKLKSLFAALSITSLVVVLALFMVQLQKSEVTEESQSPSSKISETAKTNEVFVTENAPETSIEESIIISDLGIECEQTFTLVSSEPEIYIAEEINEVTQDTTEELIEETPAEETMIEEEPIATEEPVATVTPTPVPTPEIVKQPVDAGELPEAGGISPTLLFTLGGIILVILGLLF